MSQTTSSAFFFKSPLWVLKDTTEVVKLKYLLDHIDSGLTFRENISYCFGKERGRMPMRFYDF